jgi:excisionase family DNA binding protein
VSNSLLQTPPKREAPFLALRPREAAKALGVSERTLWTWTDEGQVPFVRIGKSILYPVDSLRRWLDEQAAKTKTPSDPSQQQNGGTE